MSSFAWVLIFLTSPRPYSIDFTNESRCIIAKEKVMTALTKKGISLKHDEVFCVQK